MTASPGSPADQRLYHDLAEWWPLMSPPEEYAEEAAFYASLLLKDPLQTRPTLLELGSGGGNNASHLKQHFTLTLADPSIQMLAHSRRLNPGAEHIVGDMRTLRTGGVYDCVFIHDAIMYMTSEEDLRSAIQTAHLHTRPGGTALLAPDWVKETFAERTDCGGSDGARGGVRYLEWSWDPDPSDTTYIVDYAYLLRGADGGVRAEHDRHIEGIFPRSEWLGLIRDAGFEVEVVPFDHSEFDGALEVFLCRKPAG